MLKATMHRLPVTTLPWLTGINPTSEEMEASCSPLVLLLHIFNKQVKTKVVTLDP